MGFHLTGPWLVVLKLAAGDHQEMSAVSHSEDCPFLLPCWVDQLASIPLGMAYKPKCRGKQQHNPKRRMLGLNPAARLQLFQSPSFREGRGTPMPHLSRTSMKDAGNCPCSTRHNIVWQPVVHPRASHLPQRVPKKYLLLLIAWLRCLDILEELQLV